MHDEHGRRRGWRRCMVTGVGLALVVGMLLNALPVLAESPSAVMLVLPGDPYEPLASEIGAQEGLPLAHSLEEALASGAESVIWIVAPEQLSEPLFAQMGHTLDRADRTVALGMISGSNLEIARALWQRQPGLTGTCAVAVPREGTLETYAGGQLTASVPLDKPALIESLAGAGLFSYQGHGTRRAWHLDEETYLTSVNVPPLTGLVVSADSCQTLKFWGDESISLAFVDRGAAAYIGFLHSPLGYMIGEPKGFPMRFTWPEYPVGHLLRVQARGLSQGHISWPYLMMLDNPRLALAETPPYRVVSDVDHGATRTVALADLPAGVVPVRIAEGARYAYVHIPGVGRAYRGDPFYDSRVQMADIGAHKYLLVRQDGGPLEIRLRERAPLWWPVVDALTGALDHTAVLHHVQGSLASSVLLAAVTLAAVTLRLARRKDARHQHWRSALAVGLALTALRTGWALARQADLAAMYESYLRTMDVTWEVSPIIALANAITATGCAWLLLGTRRRWGRVLAWLGLLGPTALLALFWFGINLGLNLMAQMYYGGPLYGYGVGVMAGIAALIEAALALGIMRLVIVSTGRQPSPARSTLP